MATFRLVFFEAGAAAAAFFERRLAILRARVHNRRETTAKIRDASAMEALEPQSVRHFDPILPPTSRSSAMPSLAREAPAELAAVGPTSSTVTVVPRGPSSRGSCVTVRKRAWATERNRSSPVQPEWDSVWERSP